MSTTPPPLAIPTTAPLSVPYFTTSWIRTSCRSLGWGPFAHPSTGIPTNPATSTQRDSRNSHCNVRRPLMLPGPRNTPAVVELTEALRWV